MSIKWKLLSTILGMGTIITVMLLSSVYLEKDDNILINIAGRQRMLSQKFTKEIFFEEINKKGAESEYSQKASAKTKKLFEKTLSTLITGGTTYTDLGMKNEISLPGADVIEIKKKLIETEQNWKNLLECIDKLSGLDPNSKEFSDMLTDLNGRSVLVLKSMNQAVTIMQQEAGSRASLIKQIQFTGMIIAFGIIILTIITILKITKSVSDVSSNVQVIAEGDLTIELETNSKDELGELSDSMNSFRKGLHTIMSKLSFNGDSINSSAQNLSEISSQLLESMEGVTGQSATVASATEEISSNMSTMAATAEQMSINVANVVNNAEQVSNATNNIASSVDDVSETINKIADNSRETADISDQAARMSSEASQTMVTLGRSANEIGKVTEVIKRIADQTNLLALNATIEAASAGEAGKGFAVVANEIKELANQSARAAEDIAEKITSVQTNTTGAVEIIEQVAEIIMTINNSVNEISSSVDQQSSTINEVATSVSQTQTDMQDLADNIEEVSVGVNDLSKSTSEAAKGTDDVAASITMVNDATVSNNAGAKQVMQSVESLTEVADDLVSIVEKFKLNKN
ncbi:MAG: methyl-accepting chemotaxis protein [Rhodothermaceae bacterium]